MIDIPQGPPRINRRLRLPDRRASQTLNSRWADLDFSCIYSRDPATGHVVEVFLGNHKASSAIDLIAKDSAIVASIALQFGADFETIRKGLQRDGREAPASPLGAAMDAIAKQEVAP